MRKSIEANTHEDFYAWYDSLPSRVQAKVDDLADDLGLPLYDDCTESELSHLQMCINTNTDEVSTITNIRCSYDPTEADLYIVKIWYEVDPGYDVVGPVAAEELFSIVATSPDEAIERVKQQWSGPIDRIEIVDINPKDYDEDVPFEACTAVTASYDPYAIGEHLKHVCDLLADAHADSEVCINTLDEFKDVLYGNGFEDLDDSEITEAYNFYLEKFDEYLQGKRTMSQLSFDFVHDGYYNMVDLENMVAGALAENGCTYEASQFESVDYSDYAEYSMGDYEDKEISQMSVDFSWVDDYDASAITDSIERRLQSVDYELIGIDFRSIGD